MQHGDVLDEDFALADHCLQEMLGPSHLPGFTGTTQMVFLELDAFNAHEAPAGPLGSRTGTNSPMGAGS